MLCASQEDKYRDEIKYIKIEKSEKDSKLNVSFELSRITGIWLRNFDEYKKILHFHH